MWSSSDGCTFLRKEKQRATFAIESPVIWLTLNYIKNKRDTLVYHLFDDGGEYEIINDTLLIHSKSNHPLPKHYRFWVFLSNGNDKLYPLFKDVILKYHYNNKYYNDSINVFGTTNEIIKVNEITNQWDTLLTFSEFIGADTAYVNSLFKGLYQWDEAQKKLVKISESGADLKNYKDGLFYVPPPGSGIYLEYNLKALAEKLAAIKDIESAPEILE